MPIFYINMLNFKKYTECEPNLWKAWNSTQASDSMTFDHVIMWKIKNVIVKLSRRLQSTNEVGIHIKMKHYYLYMSCDVIIWLHSYKSLREGYWKTRWECILEQEGITPLCHGT